MRLIAVALLLAVLGSGCDGGAGATPDVDVDDAPSAAVPAGELRLHPGGWAEVATLVRRANADGRPAVVNLFASWCEPCKEEAPLLRATADANPDVAFVGVDHRDLVERGEAFLAEYPLGFPTIWDFQGEVAEAIRSRGMPTTAFFAADGRLVRLHTGILDADLLAAGIAEAREG